jgi:hypothetical protein
MTDALQAGAQSLSQRRSIIAWPALAWAGILLLFVLMRVTLVLIPFERDEGEYAYIAQRMLVGDVPYRDAFDQKPPGVFLIYLTTFALFGQSVQAVHVVMHLWTLAGVVLLFKLVQRLSGTPAGLLAALAYAVMTAGRGVLGSTANTEIFMLTPMIAGILCVTSGRGEQISAWRLIAGGALLACAFWIKQVVITDILFACIIVAVADPAPPRRYPGALLKIVRRQLLLALGAAAVTAPIFLYFILHRALHDFLYAAFIYNFGYATSELRSFSQILERFRDNFTAILICDWPFWAAGVVAIVVLFVQRNWRSLGFYLGFAVLSFAGVTFAGYFRPHYFMQMLPAVAALAGVGLAWTLARLAKIRNGSLGRAAQIALLMGVVTVPVFGNRAILFAPSPAVAMTRLYGVDRFILSQDLGQRIRERTSPADPILVAGAEPQIAFYAHRKNATRYIFFDPLTARYPEVLANQQQALAEIVSSRPAYIVDVIGAGRGGANPIAGVTEMYFFDALRRYEQSGEYTIEELWIALPEQYRDRVPRLYLCLSVDEARDASRQLGGQITAHAVVYKRIAPRT